MPIVLVTGISGFVATHVALRFLENDWTVRGTVRSSDKAKLVEDTPCFKPYKQQLELVVVEDVAEGDFTEALKGVDAVAHTASPFHMAGKSWENDYKTPAVKGTRNVLEAATKVPSIKHVVVTSSFAAIGDFSSTPTDQGGRVYTENDWNPITNEDCEKLKADDPKAAVTWYCASKKFAELEAFEVAKSASYTLATVCPPMIFGPPLHHVSSLDALNTSSGAVFMLMKPDGSSAKEVPPTTFPAFADVRDVADAHYEAVVKGKNGRFATCSGVYDNQRVVDLLNDQFGDKLKGRVAKGDVGQYLNPKTVFSLDCSKAKQELGIQFIPFEKCIEDTVDQLLTIEKQLQ